jgi:hypothetical protein
MVEVERGHYQRVFDASAVGSLSAGSVLAAEYHVDDGGGVIGDDADLLRFVTSIDDIPGDVGGGGGTGGTIVVEGEVYNFNTFVEEVPLPSSGNQGDRLVCFDTSTLGFGKVYIETNLSIIYVKFGDNSVSATTDPVDSIRLVGGAPWAIATGGCSCMSVAAAADVSIRIRGLVPV